MVFKYRLILLIFYVGFIELFKYIFFHKNTNILFINFIDRLSKKNIFYVKLFQSIGLNSKLFNNLQQDYLLKFLDKVPFNKSDIDDNILYNINNISIHSIKQINSGMIAVVYMGKLYNEDTNTYLDIVIKIKKKYIDKHVNDAINEFELIINLLDKLPKFKYLYLKDIFNECKIMLLDQLDFIMETNNLKKFYKNNKNIDYIVIPKIFEEYTEQNNNIIVMEYLNGTKIYELNCTMDIKEKYAILLIKFGIKSLLFDGQYHADLHGGNIFLIEENNKYKLGIIDFGIAGNTTLQEQNINYELLKSLFVNKNYDIASQIIINDNTILNNNKNNNNRMEPSDYSEFAILIQSIIYDIEKNNNLNFDLAYDLNKFLYKFNLKLSPNFYGIQYCLLSSINLYNKLTDNDSKGFLKNVNIICEKLIMI